MAAPGSFVPPRVSRSKPKRRFTLNQANRTLPLVSRIVADIVTAHKTVTAQRNQLDRNGPLKNRNELEKDHQRLLERLSTLVAELTEVGCEIKDFQIGLVDFTGRHQTRDISLCWKLGEATIGYWHELDAGFGGRQPVSILDERD